jgi:alanine-glyoxylate transaminase/serine-glyoxylate transaminase/serine-pyruvate transaminase
MVPGPSNLHPRVLQALLAPLTGHKDPYFLAAMDETVDLLRQVFATENRCVIALPATGGSGMEASLVNLLEPGDTLVVGSAGFFASRMVEIARRLPDVKTIVVNSKWGAPVDRDELLAAVRRHRPRVLALVHGETSTGVEQPFEQLGAACREVGGFLVVDAVATLGGIPLPIDTLGIDVCYTGTQKCLGAPPGLAPTTVSDRALAHIESRRVPVQSWYLDFALHHRFWDVEHIYHHTAPILNVYALREALRLILEEGLNARFARHALHATALRAGLDALGLRQFAAPAHRLTSVVTVLAPDGLSAAAVRNTLLEDYNLEISGGLGEYADRMWRIGIMGYSAQRANVMLLLVGLEAALRRQGFHPAANACESADAVYRGDQT